MSLLRQFYRYATIGRARLNIPACLNRPDNAGHLQLRTAVPVRSDEHMYQSTAAGLLCRYAAAALAPSAEVCHTYLYVSCKTSSLTLYAKQSRVQHVATYQNVYKANYEFFGVAAALFRCHLVSPRPRHSKWPGADDL